MEMTGYLATWNCDKGVEVTAKGSPEVFARNPVGCPFTNHCQDFVWTPWCVCVRLTFSHVVVIVMSLSCCFGSLGAPLLLSENSKPETTEPIGLKLPLNVVLTSVFCRVAKASIMLLEGNKLLLLESKGSAQPACISTRQHARKGWLILANETPQTRSWCLKGKQDPCKTPTFLDNEVENANHLELVFQVSCLSCHWRNLKA